MTMSKDEGGEQVENHRDPGSLSNVSADQEEKDTQMTSNGVISEMLSQAQSDFSNAIAVSPFININVKMKNGVE